MDLKTIRQVPNGTVLLMELQYRSPDMTPEGQDKVWSYVWLKAGGLWYGSGTGDVPQAAGWGAVERWLGKRNRRLISIRAMTSGPILYSHRDSDVVDGEVVGSGREIST